MMEVGFRSGLSDSSSPPFPPPTPRLWTPAYKAHPGEWMSLAQLEGGRGDVEAPSLTQVGRVRGYVAGTSVTDAPGQALWGPSRPSPCFREDHVCQDGQGLVRSLALTF